MRQRHDEPQVDRRERTMDDGTLCAACRTVPLSHLHLDLSEPVQGWEMFLAERSIEIVEDVSGRPSIPRWALTRLLDERRERERTVAEAAERATRMTAAVGAGVPALPDSTAYESLLAPEAVSPQEEFGRPRPNFLEEALEAGSRAQAAEREAVKRRKGETR
jgi:hypothetical protein